MSLDLGPALRTALSEAAGIGDQLSEWNGEAAVFTRRPVPSDAQTVFIIVNPNASLTDEDALTSDRPVVARDIAIYGTKAEPGDPTDQTRLVEALGYAVRDLFHRQKFSVRPEGYSVISVVAAGPFPAPVDDEVTVGRVVGLTIRLRRNGT